VVKSENIAYAGRKNEARSTKYCFYYARPGSGEKPGPGVKTETRILNYCHS
jgi:hypothetical protein